LASRNKIDSREVGLVIGLIFSRYLLDSEYLHYGYWTEDMEVNFQGMKAAQEKYADFLASQIPGEKLQILDVGCGTGMFASYLTERGHKVDCVSPAMLLTKRAQELLGDAVTIYQCMFEDLQTDNRYDLILFSESFQYVNIKKALDKCSTLLNDEGHVLISDFFRTSQSGNGNGKSLIGGGHKFTKFERIVAEYPFNLVHDTDITDETAPSINVFNDFTVKVGKPVHELIMHVLNNNHPLFHRIIKWKYREKLEKIDRKYFSGKRDAEHFKLHKTYRCLLYQKSGHVSEGVDD